MAVKIVLRQDVEHLGDRGQIVNVAPGYARNSLIPKGLAYTATSGNLRVLELEKRAGVRHEAKEADEARGASEASRRRLSSATAAVAYPRRRCSGGVQTGPMRATPPTAGAWRTSATSRPSWCQSSNDPRLERAERS